MSITKYLHSCLLIEEDNKTILIDPGMYTFDAGIFPFGSLEKLDAIVITHEHFDHCFLPFIKKLQEQFPSVPIYCNTAIAQILQKEHIAVSVDLPNFITAESAPHEKLLDTPTPQNTAYTFFHKLTHPGDSLQFTKTAAILALPVQAPWGSMVQAAEKAVVIKPKTIIPIHDWHWRDEARKGFYERLAIYFENYEIFFQKIETGIPVKLEEY